MEQSILISTKKVLGLDQSFTVFDLDIVSHINLAFSTLNQIGVGPDGGFAIEDDTAKWADLNLDTNYVSMIKTYVLLKARMLFDPPTSGFLMEATKEQIKELEARLSLLREVDAV